MATNSKMESDKKIYKKNIDVVSRNIAGEIILVPVRKKSEELDCIYTLNEVGAYIWSLIDGEKSLDEIKNDIEKKFEVPGKQVGKDIEEFFKTLNSAHLIQKNDKRN